MHSIITKRDVREKSKWYPQNRTTPNTICRWPTRRELLNPVWKSTNGPTMFTNTPPKETWWLWFQTVQQC